MAKIEKRGEASYRFTVSCGYDKQGKQIVKRKTIDLSHIKPNKQDDEAQKEWILFKDQVQKGLYLDSGKITFEDFIQKWLNDYAEHELAPKTLLSYKQLLNNRIIPALGHIKLNKLQPVHLIEFYNNLREDGMRLDKKYTPKKNLIETLSASGLTLKELSIRADIKQNTLRNIKQGKNATYDIALKTSKYMDFGIDKLFTAVEGSGTLSGRTIQYHHRLISSILETAVKWQFILNNPAERLDAPKVAKKEVKCFSVEQTQYMLDLLEYEPLKYKAAVYIAVWGGLRLGEICGLEWDAINLKTGLIKICQASQYIPHEGIHTKSPKNDSSVRELYLPKEAIVVLKEYKLWQNGEKATLGDLWADTDRIFTTQYGKYIFPDTISKWFHKFLIKHNANIMKDNNILDDQKKKYLLPVINFHALRHTNATLMIADGTDIPTVSKRLGHAQSSTTLNIYAHSLDKSNLEAATKLSSLLSKNRQNEKQV